MAVIISNGATSLSTPSGFYRVEAHNLMPVSATSLALTSTRTIAVTFANAGNCQGIGLWLRCTDATNDRSITVTLQQNVASVWTDRATVTLTAATIKAAASALDYFEDLIVPISGGTFPYAVTTAGSTWRFQVVQSGGTTGTWNLETSDGTNPCYFAWCDNALSYSSGDTLICKDVVTVDQSAALNSVAATGTTSAAAALVVCRGADPSVANLQWANPPASSYTLTINGCATISARGGVRVGSSGSRIPYAQQAIIIFGTPTVGSTSGFAGYRVTTTPATSRNNIWMYGEVPAYQRTTLASNAASGQPNITTVDSTGWGVGDAIAVGRQNARGFGDQTTYAISAISGTAITLTANLATNQRLAGGLVTNLSRYGVWLYSTYASSTQHYLGNPANLVLSGVRQGDGVRGVTWNLRGSQQSSASVTSEDSAWTAGYAIEYGSVHEPIATQIITSLMVPEKGVTIASLMVHRGSFLATLTQASASGAFTVTACALTAIRTMAFGTPTGAGITVSSNVVENTDGYFQIGGASAVFQDNVFFGGSGATGVVRIGTLVNTTSWSGNRYDNCAVALNLGAAIALNDRGTNDVFGAAVANTADIDFGPGGGLFDLELASPTGALAVATTLLPQSVAGSRLAVTDYNDTANDDRNWLPAGYLVRTGAGLSDTTCRTAGGYALRFQPNSGTNLLQWSQSVPTGDIATKTMTVSAWVYIASALYAAGTHTRPQLVVTYDNGTMATATATASYGSWQQLAVTFTPATAYGQITVTLQGATDAAGANAYFYVDDVNIAYPAGVAPNLGGLDLWANALPVTPTIAVFPGVGGVWDELLTSHTVAGSFGAFVKTLLTVAKFLGLK